MFEGLGLIAFDSAATAFQMFIVHMHLKVFLNEKTANKVRFGAYLVFGIALVTMSLICPNMYLTLATTFCGVLSISFIQFGGPNHSRFFAAFLFCLIAALTEIVSSEIVAIATTSHVVAVFEYGLNRIVGSIVACSIFLMIIKIMGIAKKESDVSEESADSCLMIGNYAENMENYNERLAKKTLTRLWALTPLLIFIIFSIYLLLLCFDSMTALPEQFPVKFFIGILAIVYMNVIVFWYYDRIIRSYKLKHINEVMEIKTKNLMKYYESARMNQEQSKALYHDIFKHVKVMEGLAVDHPLAIEYLENYKGSLKQADSFVSVPNPVVSVILSDCITRASKLGVEPEISIALPNGFDIDPTDITIILGNTIENALRVLSANTENTEKKLTILLRQRGSFLLYEISNSYVTVENTATRTGYGLRNVNACVRKYSGAVTTTENNGIYTVTVVMQI